MPRIDTTTCRNAAEILALQRLAYQSEAILYDDWTIPPLTQTLAELEGELTLATCLVLRDPEGRLIGSVRAVMCAGSCHIGRLIVHPQHQRQGVGTKLMGAIEAAFPTASRFELFTGSRSEGNIRLYQRLGYRIFSRKQLAPQIELVMLEKLRPATDYELQRWSGCEVSLNRLPAGKAMPFVHAHKKNEELYIVLGGSGTFSVDGEEFPVQEGSLVRVAPAGARTWQAGDEVLYFICIQAEAGSLTQATLRDGMRCDEKASWTGKNSEK